MARGNDSFNSRIGVVLTIIGSAVGFGNFWRFPYLLGENGGAAFLFVYLIISLILGIPLIVSEYIIGRSTHKDFIGAFKKLRPGSKWFLTGYLTVLTVILVTSFYCVIGGWTLHALYQTIIPCDSPQNADYFKESFNGFINTGWEPILLTLLFIGTSCHVVSRGIEKGSEKYNKILIPTLMLVLIIMCIYSVSLPGFGQCTDFLFTADFSKITLGSIINAFGQVFFSLSVGMGIYATYASYVNREESVVKDQATIALCDIIIAVLAGIIIFSAVFSFGIEPDSGPTLVFIALPSLFSQMPFGNLFGFLFYGTLTIAAITSAISLIEVLATSFVDQFGLSRKKACVYILIIESTLAIICALSQVEGIEINIMGLNFFDFLDFMTANWMLTIACILTSIFIGWKMDKKTARDVITQGGKYTTWFFRPYLFILKYIVPLALIILIINRIGLVK